MAMRRALFSGPRGLGWSVIYCDEKGYAGSTILSSKRAFDTVGQDMDLFGDPAKPQGRGY